MGINFNEIALFLEKYANLFLVVITAIYAFLTFSMVCLMKRQIISNIRVSKAVFRAFLVSKKNGSRPIQLRDFSANQFFKEKNSVLLFRVSADFLNSSAGSGTIDRPKLVLRSKKRKFCHEVRPTEERIGNARKTVFIPGGGFEKIDLEYFISCDKEFLKNMKTCFEKLDFFIKYKDNLGKDHLVKIEEL